MLVLLGILGLASAQLCWPHDVVSGGDAGTPFVFDNLGSTQLSVPYETEQLFAISESDCRAKCLQTAYCVGYVQTQVSPPVCKVLVGSASGQYIQHTLAYPYERAASIVYQCPQVTEPRNISFASQNLRVLSVSAAHDVECTHTALYVVTGTQDGSERIMLGAGFLSARVLRPTLDVAVEAATGAVLGVVALVAIVVHLRVVAFSD